MSVLPIGYIPYQFIQSDGNQYIDTGLVINKNDTYSLEIEGCWYDSNYAGANGYLQFKGDVIGSTKSTLRVEYDGTTHIEKIYVNDKLKLSTDWTNSYSGVNVKLGLFRLGDSGNTWWTGGNNQTAKMYSCVIRKKNDIVRSYVPCKNANGKIGLYDTVNNVFYKNFGTGSFTGIVITPDPPTDLTYTLDRGVVTLNWVASGSENVTGYVVTYKKGSTVASTSSVTGTTDSYRITPGSWTVSVVTNQNGLYSGEVTVSFTIQAISNPSNLQGSIGDGGIGSITWTGTTDSNVLGYSIYMLSPMRVLVGYSPYGKPLFKFAFENNSLTDKLIEMSTFLQDTFLYQLEPRKQYTFAVVSSNKEYENIPEDGPKIHMYYSTSVSFKSFSLKPNPVYTKESLIISAEVTEKIDSTITTS